MHITFIIFVFTPPPLTFDLQMQVYKEYTGALETQLRDGTSQQPERGDTRYAHARAHIQRDAAAPRFLWLGSQWGCASRRVCPFAIPLLHKPVCSLLSTAYLSSQLGGRHRTAHSTQNRRLRSRLLAAELLETHTIYRGLYIQSSSARTVCAVLQTNGAAVLQVYMLQTTSWLR
jgi:hypothetical protein